mmetsp:Transcript_6638/g.16468  ORF Transcript_6638/g.16468 Transcript_6638/m.16468 type:complete len:229 (-) Transcript_6638:135-821(-)
MAALGDASSSWRGSRIDQEVRAQPATARTGGLNETSLGVLKREPYETTRPFLPCFTRHAEFLKDGRGRLVKTEAATWQLGLRSQTPAFTSQKLTMHDGKLKASTSPKQSLKEKKEQEKGADCAADALQTPRGEYEHRFEKTPPPRWIANFHGIRDHSFDMLRELYENPLSEENREPRRTPRVHVDSHRAKRHHDEPFTGRVAPNLDIYRSHLRAGVHPDVCRYLVNLR